MKRLVLIDGHGILHRAYHALPPLTTSKGELINAVFGFTSMLLRVIADLQPTHIAVAFDRPEPTFREKIFKDYQAQRPKMDEELAGQIDTVKKVLQEMGIEIFEKAGFEADDIIGTLALKASGRDIKYQISKIKKTDQKSKIDQDIETIIVTGDRDILQLVDDKTKVYMPIKGLSQSKLYDEREVEEKFGIKPAQMVDYKALVGDPADNYKGVSGIGPKTADSLLKRFKTLEEVYKQLNQIDSEKLRRALKQNEESAKMAKKLARIVQDVPMEIDLAKCKLGNLDRANVHALFEELEFRSLISRLSQGRKKNETKSQRNNQLTLV